MMFAAVRQYYERWKERDGTDDVLHEDGGEEEVEGQGKE